MKNDNLIKIAIGKYKSGGYKEQSIYLEPKYVRSYNRSVAYNTNVTMCAETLIDFLVEKMDNDNSVANTPRLREQFIQRVQDDCKRDEVPCIVYKDGTVQNAFEELCDVNILLRESRASFIVNPLYFAKGSDRRRELVIKFYQKKVDLRTVFYDDDEDTNHRLVREEDLDDVELKMPVVGKKDDWD